ncbi:MAG TPA: DUF6157 family protein [Moheibacter sp.]|nr:DUF6157 family protein [Moheibacter sp.]
MHTTNYYNTFIEISDDCPVFESEIPKERGGNKSVALLQFEMIAHNPYQFTSDEVLFNIHALRKDLAPNEENKQEFFSKDKLVFVLLLWQNVMAGAFILMKTVRWRFIIWIRPNIKI